MNVGTMLGAVRDLALAVLGADRDPFDPQNAHMFDASGVGAGPTLAGVNVTTQAALRSSAFWGGVTLLADTFARPPLLLYRTSDRGGDRVDKRRALKDPLYRVLATAPNRWQTPFLWKQSCLLHRLLGGNTVCEIVDDGRGQVIELVPLRPDRVHIGGDGDFGDDAEPPTFTTWDKTGQPRTLLRTEVLYVPMANVHGKRGMSVLAAARDALGVSIAAADHSARTFGKGLLQRVLLSHPRTLTPKGREMWDSELEKQAGPDGAGRWLIMPEGMTIHGISINPRDAQLLEARQFGVLEICRFLRLPPQLLGETSAGMSYASVEQFIDYFVSTTMDAYYRPFEEEVAFSLLTDPAHSVEFLRQALLRADVKTRWMAYSIGLQNGVFVRNEVREFENLPRIEGLDEPLRRLDMTTPKERAALAAGWQDWRGKEADHAERREQARAWEADVRRMRGLAEAAARRLARSEARFVARLVALAPDDRTSAADEFYRGWASAAARALVVDDLRLRALAEERGSALLEQAEAGAVDAGRFGAGLVRRLVRLALYEPQAA